MTALITETTRAQIAAAIACMLAVALGVAPLEAKEIPSQDVTAAVETWVRHVTADARPDADLERLEPHLVDGTTVAYIAYLADGGYCICGADDRLLPVYLYNAGGVYDPTNPNYQAILNQIVARFAKVDAATRRGDPVLNQYQQMLRERADCWKDLIARRVPAPRGGAGDRGDPQLMALPVNDTWHQGSPYNDYCPELTPNADEHTIVGCVATGMAEIMYYWQWPNAGSASNSVWYFYRYTEPPAWLVEPLADDPNLPGWCPGRLEWHSANGGELRMSGYWDDSLYEEAWGHSADGAYRAALANLWDQMESAGTDCSADFGAATYDWSIMPDTAPDPPDAGALEAAEISYHAGVAAHMEYGLFASSSNNFLAGHAYRSYFDYDPDAIKIGRNVATMIAEIQWLRPVQIGGQSDTGGHSWVVAGYNTGTTPTEFLMNMGWGGGTTEWYSVDEMFPDEQDHVVQIAPEGVVRFIDCGVSGGDGSPAEPYLGLAGALSDAPDNTTLIMKAGSTHTLPGSPVVLDRPMTLKGYDVTIAPE